MAEHFGIKAPNAVRLRPNFKEDKTLFKKTLGKLCTQPYAVRNSVETQVSGQAECCLCQMFVPMPFIHVITK
jgi:hypothetical protein